MAGQTRDAHVYLPLDFYKKLQAEAKKNCRSVSAEILWRLVESVKK